MLLRTGLLYGFSVLCFLLFGLVVWQGLSLSAGGEAYDTLSRRHEALAKDYADLKVKVQSSDRRAHVAEDSLSRIGAVNAFDQKALDEARAELAAAVSAKIAAEAALELRNAAADAAVAERDAATADLSALQAKIAKAEAETTRLREALPRAAAGPATPKPASKPRQTPVAEKSAAALATDEIVIDSDRPGKNWNSQTTVKAATGTPATGEAKPATPKTAIPVVVSEQNAAAPEPPPEPVTATAAAEAPPPAAPAPAARRPRKTYTTEEGLDMYFPF